MATASRSTIPHRWHISLGRFFESSRNHSCSMQSFSQPSESHMAIPLRGYPSILIIFSMKT